MKRFLSILLALTLCLSLCGAAFAATGERTVYVGASSDNLILSQSITIE